MILLRPIRSFKMGLPAAYVLRVSGFDESRLMVLSHRPVQMIEKHEVLGWHNWLRTMGSWALQRTELPFRTAT